MNNQKMDEGVVVVVTDAVYVSVEGVGIAVNLAGNLAVYRAVRGTVSRATNWVVTGAMYWAVYNTRQDPEHPALQDFLKGVET